MGRIVLIRVSGDGLDPQGSRDADPISGGREEADASRPPYAGVSPDFRSRLLQVRCRGYPSIPLESDETSPPPPSWSSSPQTVGRSRREHFSSLMAEIVIDSPALFSVLRGGCHCPSALYEE